MQTSGHIADSEDRAARAATARRQRALRAAARSGASGFTLVELIIALTAGLLVSASAYLLARNSMTSYQEESRIASSQVGVSIGMSRLQGDLARAGYMSTPNATALLPVDRDPNLCTDPNSRAPLNALSIAAEGAGLTGFGYGSGGNPDEPDVLVVTGNMTSSEQFEYRGIVGDQVFLALDRGPMRRLVRETGLDAAAIEAVFVPMTSTGVQFHNRFARIVDQSGKESYVIVTGATAVINAGVLDSVTLTITLPDGSTPTTSTGTECGYVGRGSGLINPVSVIRYRIGQVCEPYAGCAGDPYGLALAATGPAAADVVTGESIRTELLREEIAPESVGAALTNMGLGVVAGELNSREIVAEYAVDLDVAVVYATDATGTTLGLYDFGAPEVDSASGPAPQRLRSLRVKLSTRARVPDREDPGPAGLANRFLLAPVAAANTRLQYARMRTLQTEIQLPNLQGLAW